VLAREKRKHHIAITLDLFMEAGEVRRILERASNRFDRVVKYQIILDIYMILWAITGPSNGSRCVSMAAERI
jgi:hypothetical protein